MNDRANNEPPQPPRQTDSQTDTSPAHAPPPVGAAPPQVRPRRKQPAGNTSGAPAKLALIFGLAGITPFVGIGFAIAAVALAVYTLVKDRPGRGHTIGGIVAGVLLAPLSTFGGL
ncbi:MAG: hypothetical protein ACOC8F_03655 [Planctomycetota bacterium]